jgi:hypothetical protein
MRGPHPVEIKRGFNGSFGRNTALFLGVDAHCVGLLLDPERVIAGY